MVTEKKYEVQFWKPNEGDILEGKVTDMGKTITSFGETEYVRVDKDREKYMVFLNPVLKRLLVEQKVQVGDLISIRFDGFRQSQKSKRKKYKMYTLWKGNGIDGGDSGGK